ncbi:MAG: ROK family transcriptional regulator [Chloroflexi bacterium]|nr:ROK family transcriptional regulator [Chloroflexota bacterium]
MRRINAAAVLDLIRRDGRTSRTDIGDTLNLSLPTVMRIVDQLMEANLVVPAGSHSQENGVGRPQNLLQFNAEGNLVIGADVGGTKIYGATANLGGQILYEQQVRHQETKSAEEYYTRLLALVGELLATAQARGKRVLGIAVGAPGETQHEEGVVRWAPALNWRDFPLKARLQEATGLPVVVENDVNLAALGEYWFGAVADGAFALQNIVLLSIGTGIGAGIILEGQLYRGARSSAGEIGYLLPGRCFLGERYDGFGAFEQVASGSGIAARARVALAGEWPAEALAGVTAETVFAAARDGDNWAIPIIAETCETLALGIAAIHTLLDPECVILGGGVAQAADLLIPAIENCLEGTLPQVPRILPSRLGQRAVVLGGITRLLHQTADYYVARKLS